ncbi:hypothetical protein ACFFRR_011767 [Megaselia abdita]
MKSFVAVILLVAAVSADVSHILPQQEYLPPHQASYDAPSSGYGYSAPAPVQYQTYSAPAVQYSAPAVQYSAPAVQYSAPAHQYSAPAVEYSAPAVEYSAPAQSYETQSYSAPAVSFQNFNAHHSSSYDIPAQSSYSSYNAPLTHTSYSAPDVSSYSGPAVSSYSAPSHGGYHYNNPIFKRVK